MRSAALAFLLLLGAAPASLAEEDRSVRVRIVEGAGSVRLEGAGLRLDGRPAGGGAVLVTRRGGALAGAGKALGASVTAQGSGVRVNGRAARAPLRFAAAPGGGIDAVELVPLERYVAATLAGEIYASWPAEVLKAQAVATRSYVLHQSLRQAGQTFDVEQSVISQRFVSDARIAPAIQSAVNATRGQTLTYAGRPILAAFHASSGGRTASADEIWGEALPYLTSVASPDETSPDFFWSFAIALEDAAAALRESSFEPGPLHGSADVEILARSPSGRVAELRIGQVVLRGHDLRQIFGGRALRSTRFDVRVHDDRLVFLGSGAGHGVGLCQWGARELARRGKRFDEILAHYYPGARLGFEPQALAAQASW